jgi:hypothetical protein
MCPETIEMLLLIIIDNGSAISERMHQEETSEKATLNE